MKLRFLSLFCAFLMLSCGSGEMFPSSDPLGSYTDYPFEKFREVSAPRGYKPVYFSNISRHTGRYDISSPSLYVRLDTLFSKALSCGCLTDEGKAFYEDFQKMYGDAVGHEGEITPHGRETLLRIADNLSYHVFAQGGSDKGRHWALHCPILRDFIDKAEEDLSGGRCRFRLRFVHDSQIAPFIKLLGDSRLEIQSDDWRQVSDIFDWGYTPMAANVQMIFFRNDEGNTLVRVLMNDRDMPLQLQAERGVYYSWNDLKAYLEGRFDLAKSILAL